MKNLRKLLLVLSVFIFILAFSLPAIAQTVTLTGKAYDKDNRNLPLPKLMIINKRTNQGVFADAESKFSIIILPSDTIIFSAIGFRFRSMCFKDSIAKGQKNIEVALSKLQFELKEVSVFAERNLNEIQKDIDNLGVKSTYSVSGVNAFESPVTALYERFSKFGKAKRKVAEWENEDLKRDILKDLFHLYVKYEVIDLPDEEFDDFIQYLNLSDEFIQNASQFELVMAIKGKYESFKYRWR
ncbi:MAG: hypothetical protein H0X46_05775 [Bacteroidetes bacterium]|nr:hypothetical protein [Bacteroidota bacterium]